MIKAHSILLVLLGVAVAVGAASFVCGCEGRGEADAELMQRAFQEAHVGVARKEFVRGTRRWAMDVHLALTTNRVLANSLASANQAAGVDPAAGGAKSEATLKLEQKLATQKQNILTGLHRHTTPGLYAQLAGDAVSLERFFENLFGVSEDTEQQVNENTWVYRSANMSSVYVVFENRRFRISNVQQ